MQGGGATAPAVAAAGAKRESPGPRGGDAKGKRGNAPRKKGAEFGEKEERGFVGQVGIGQSSNSGVSVLGVFEVRRVLRVCVN